MRTQIALLRGINVGGKNLLPMEGLRRLLADLGCLNIHTYLQNGNAVFQHAVEGAAVLAERMGAAIVEGYAFRPELMILESGELAAAMASNPFPEAVTDPSTLHLVFLSSIPESPDLASLDAVRRDGERYALKGRVLYLHAPDGIGRSKLAARIERSLGVSGTSRNWRTVTKIAALVEGGVARGQA